MSLKITGYRIFIASPGGLQREREAFRQTIEEYNVTDAIPRNVLFLPIGWEDTLGGVGRPQSIIDEDIRKCDYFLLLLWDRWGTPPDDSGRYTSGTEEEYNVALDCLAHARYPMRQILAFFKAVDPRKLSDPGPELTKVLRFKQDLETSRKLLHQTFDEVLTFQRYLRAHLSRWLRDNDAGDLGKAGATDETAPLDKSVGVMTLRSVLPSFRLDEAERLANEGRLTEAETAFARAVAGGNDADAFERYGNFLVRAGRLAQAQVMYERVLELKASDPKWQARIYASLGSLYKIRGDYGRAEELFRRALDIELSVDHLEGIAEQCANIGMVLKRRELLDDAEEMQRKALAIYERLEDVEGQARTYGNLGVIYRKRGQSSQAESYLDRSLVLSQESNSLVDLTRAYGNLGVIYRNRGDLPRAEEMFAKSLELNMKLNSVVGLATQYGNLGLTYLARGELDRSEQMLLKSLELNEKLGSRNGLAKQFSSLGDLYEARGDGDQAQAFWRKASDLFGEIGSRQKVAELRDRLNRSAKVAPLSAGRAARERQGAPN